MGIIDRLRNALIEPSIDDVQLYAAISKEIDSGFMREGIWAKALAESDFNDAKARALYMKMAVKALQKELSDKVIQDANYIQNAMSQARSLFNEKRYDEAIDGLSLRVERLNDGIAASALAYIAWYGVSQNGVDKDLANKLIDFAEKSTDPQTRCFLGKILEPIDWIRALNNYDYASSDNEEARLRSKYLRNR